MIAPHQMDVAWSVEPLADRYAASRSFDSQGPQLIDRPTADRRADPGTGHAAMVPLPPPEKVLTRERDSLWCVSQRVYGIGSYYRALYEHNRLHLPRPDQLVAGLEIYTPPREELRQLYPDLCPEETDILSGSR
jgi:nucleoid-associated protein YgaU